MIKEKVILKNETGLHARPAGELAKLASTFKSNINLNVNGKTVSAKSILGIMSLGIKVLKLKLNVMEKMKKMQCQKY